MAWASQAIENETPFSFFEEKSSQINKAYQSRTEKMEKVSDLQHKQDSMSTDEEIILLGGDEHFHLQEFDQFCTNDNTENNVCTIKDKQIRFTHDVYYATNKTMIFDGSKVKCQTTGYAPCTLHFFLEGGRNTFFEVRNSSTLQAKQIIVQAPDSEVRILENSTIWVSGQSLNINGTLTNGWGASFIGHGGGYCSNQNEVTDISKVFTYGEFDMVPNKDFLQKYFSQMGSFGKRDDIETAGGGRIIVISDSITFEGQGEKLTANARPYKDFEAKSSYSLQGGSGGYIYVSTANEHRNNTLDDESKISAQGGLGIGEYSGGSGGVIVFDDQFHMSSSNTKVNGGQAELDDIADDGCRNGASGTIYYRFNDTLLVDNAEMNSTAFTQVRVPDHKELIDDRLELSKKLYLQNGARLVIYGEHKDMTFDEMYVYNHSWLQLSQSEDRCHLHITNSSYFSATSTLDFSHTKWVGIYPAENVTDTTIGNIFYQEFIGIQGENINMIGDIALGTHVKDTYGPVSKVIVESQNITLFQDAKIFAGNILLHANETLKLMEGSQIHSLREHTCNLDKDSKDLFTCIKPFSLEDQLSTEYVTANFEEQFPQIEALHSFTSLLTGLMHNYTTYLVSNKQIDLYETHIQGPRIGICTTNLTMVDSKLDASGHGCLGDEGMSRGRQSGQCAGSGGANAGIGGYGGISSENNGDNQAQCQDHFPQAYTQNNGLSFEGSGGASGASQTDKGGNGGGIIRLNVMDTMDLRNSLILANGLPGEAAMTESYMNAPGSGGGAGGSIQIMTRNIMGNSKIEARGGDGSIGGGGGGSGGRMVISFLRGYSAKAQPAQSHYWAGSYTINGGRYGIIYVDDENESYTNGEKGQDGQILSDKCFGGYNGPFCERCPQGTFKYDYGYSICRPCDNKPQNSFYTGLAVSNANCPYECSQGLDPAEVNPECQNALEIQSTRLGGMFSTLFAFSIFFTLVTLMWVALIIRSKLKSFDLNSFNSKVYDGVLFNTDIDLSPEQKIMNPRNLAMRDEDIWSHSHRMYLLGDNSVKFPWFVSKDFPFNSLDTEDQDKLLQFISEKQTVVEWSSLQKDLYFTFRMVCPPIADLIHKCFRKRHFDALQNEIYKSFNEEFWDMNSMEGKTLRVSSSTKDYQLAYIDFVNFDKKKKDYIGPQLPITLLLAGRGTFNCPYYLNFENDALAKSIVYFHKLTLKDQLPLFFENLNTLLGKLSFYKFTGQSTRDLSEIIEWIELGNKTLFNPLDTKATLYLFENSYEQSQDEHNFSQKRRSFPMESVVFESFPDVYKAMIEFINSKLMGGESEIRLGLVFKPFDLEKRNQLMDRIRKIMAQNKSNLHNLSNSKKERAQNLIYADSHEEEFYILNGTSPTSSLYSKQNSVQTSISDSSDMQESSIFIHGSGHSKQVKIIDKSKRAFEISHQSTEALELSLQKPRNSFRFRLQALKGLIYSTYLMLFKHQGLPPKKGSRYPYYLAFAFFVALDKMLTMIISFHIFNPMTNMYKIGIPFYLLVPGMTAGSILGTMSCFTGNPNILKLQSSFNSTAVLLNYPLTIASMIWFGSDPFYIAVVILLIFNKIPISYMNAKLRQHLLNPGFSKNHQKIQDRFRSLVQAKSEVEAGIKPGMSAQERASQMVNSGRPSFMAQSSNAGKEKKLRMSKQTSLVESDEEYDDEDDTSFGIIPKNRLLEDTRQRMTEF